jgi:hypothetical protein
MAQDELASGDIPFQRDANPFHGKESTLGWEDLLWSMGLGRTE